MKYFLVKKESENIVNKWEDTEKNRKRAEDWGYAEYTGETEVDDNGTLYVKGTIPAEDADVTKLRQITELQRFLNNTDWYVARYTETGKEIPTEIKEQRQKAREKIDALRGE